MFVFILCTLARAQTPTWEGLYTKAGWGYEHTTETSVGEVEVYKKWIGDLPCFQGKTTTRFGPDLLLEIAADAESAVHWSSADVVEAKTLYRSASHVDYYQYLNVPIFSDRYWFLRGYVEREENEVRFRWEPLEEGAHEDFYRQTKEKYPSAVETSINLGAWVFRTVSNQTEVRYYICTHPGGSVPSALQSIGTEQTLPNNLQDLIIEAQRRSEG